MIRAVRVNDEGLRQITHESNDLTLAQINEIVGGEVEIVPLAHGAVAIQNRDGEQLGLVPWTIRTTTETGWPRHLQMYGSAVLVDRDEAKKLLG